MKNIVNVLLLTTATSLAVAAPLGDLKVANSTKDDLSFRVNNICAEKMGNVDPYIVQVIARDRINDVCQANPKHCVIVAFNAKNCAGGLVTAFVLDTTGRGIIDIMPTYGYRVHGDGFNLFFDGWTK